MTTPFVALVQAQAKVLGLPSVPRVVLPHPIGGLTIGEIAPKLDAVLDELLGKLTEPLPHTADIGASVPTIERLTLGSDKSWEAFQREFDRRGWGDGLPLVAPTEARVERMLQFVDRPRDAVIAAVPPRMGAATVETIAVNGVMAGCRPQHLPLLIAAVEALADRAFNLYGIQATTHCVSPLLIVNGPLSPALRINASSGMFGPGPWDNGVVGRAIRLGLLNVGGGVPVEIDKSTMGHPAKYTFVMAENEAASPWPSLRVERGFDDEVSTVTVVGAEGPHNINDHESTMADGVIRMMVGSMATTGQNNVYYAGEPLLIVSPEHAATIAAGGYGKADLQRRLFDDARIPLNRFSRENIERRMYRKFPELYKDQPEDVGVRIAQCAKDIMVVVGGGPGKHSMYVPTFGGTRSVTRAIVRADGSAYLPEQLGE